MISQICSLADPLRSANSNLDTQKLHPILYWVPLLLLLAFLFCLSIDVTVARFFHDVRMPSFLRELVENTEPFGHGIGVVVLICSIAVVHRDYFRRYIFAVGIALGAGICTNILKFIIGRSRPRDLDLADLNVADTFTGWFPYLNGNTLSQSFPSGHTTVAFALAFMLAHHFPHARVLFAGLAAFVAYGRVQCGAHYPSDVLAGATVGCTVACTALIWLSHSRVAVTSQTKSLPRTVESQEKQAA